MDTIGTIGNYINLSFIKRCPFIFQELQMTIYAPLTIMDSWAAKSIILLCISMGEKMDKRCYSIDQILLIGKNMRLSMWALLQLGGHLHAYDLMVGVVTVVNDLAY